MTKDYSKPLKLTLQDIYVENIVYDSRPSYEENPWLKAEVDQSDFLTAREMIISKMPMIVHEACITKNVEKILQSVGETIPDNLYTFKNKEEYETLLKNITDNNKKIFFQYIHGSSICEDDDYAINKPKFIDLNNKAKISKWTKGKFLPKREVVRIEDFEQKISEWQLPFVIKPGDELPTAGGYGVMICYSEEDLNKAIDRLKKAEDTENVIIEQFIEEIDNYCVQYAYSEEKGIQYLGAVKQLTNKYGFYNGNINSTNVPQSVIDAGYEIMQNGVNAGYVGVSGFDILIDKNHDVFAIDLNFRQNGSTSMLLLKDRLTEGFHKFFSYHSKGDNIHFLDTIMKFIEKGHLYPLSYFDGDWFGRDKKKSRFSCVWHAETEEEVLQQEAAFLKMLEQK